MIELLLCPRNHPEYQRFRNRHYVVNHGTIGQQLHYLILYHQQLIGIITGSSASLISTTWDFFGITRATQKYALSSIINNSVFRLELQEKNLATQILSRWRKQIAIDWQTIYNATVCGFETFVEPSATRKGTIYQADNWIYLGTTKGFKKIGCGIKSTKSSYTHTTAKLIFAFRIPHRKFTENYTPSWEMSTPENKEVYTTRKKVREEYYNVTQARLVELQVI